MRKELFHFSQINAYQFVTFRTKASIDDFLKRMKETKLDETNKQFEMDKYLVTSDKGRLLNDGVIELIIEYCKNLDPKFYRLICLTVMPNHMHMLFEQKQNLSTIIQKVKGGLAYKINKHLSINGSLWERSYFYKAIGDEKHLQLTYDYIMNNAHKAELVDTDKSFFSVYE